jgi:methylmalonyl-CoA mutase cobalamin-binding domain/chain
LKIFKEVFIMSEAIVQEISGFLQKGRAKNVKALVQQALDEGVDAKTILNVIIGGKFKRNEVFVPEVLVAARAMNAGIAILEPKLVEMGNEPIGKAVVGTVKGDLHDIGKNLVVMMLKGAGLEIHDLGVDVEPSVFLEKAEEIGADVIGMSALLTTTMPNMKDVVDLLNEKGVRDKYIVMVGGAPVNESFAEEIGADYYTPDAATAAEVAKKAVLEKKAL